MRSASEKGKTLSGSAVEAVATAGELLIRAAAVLGKLTPEELEALSKATEGKLPGSIAWALEGAAAASTQTRESLATHPPAGWEVGIATGVYVGYKGTP